MTFRMFMAIYEGIGRKLGQMKKDESLELANFLLGPELGLTCTHLCLAF